MSTLKNVKREEYKKILKEEITNVTDDMLDNVIDYLFSLASIEQSILEQIEHEKKDCNFDGESI